MCCQSITLSYILTRPHKIPRQCYLMEYGDLTSLPWRLVVVCTWSIDCQMLLWPMKSNKSFHQYLRYCYKNGTSTTVLVYKVLPNTSSSNLQAQAPTKPVYLSMLLVTELAWTASNEGQLKNK